MADAGAVEKVKARLDAFIAALLRPERVTLENLASPRLSYGHSNGRVENREQFILNMLDGGSRFLTIQLSDETVDVTGEIAIARHILHAHTHDKGSEPGVIRIGILLVWRLEQGEWMLLARQAFRLPQ